MRKLILALATVLCSSAVAQTVVPFSPGMLIPSPLGVVITLGTWIYDANQQRVYYIEVIGEGRDPEESRKNGFRLAVEQAVGSIIASETEVQNNRVARDEIISYASGYVTRYEIIQQLPSPIGARTVMKVWVAKNPIANRLLNESKVAGRVEGSQAAVSFTTLVEERVAGDKLVAAVLSDYPRRAYDIEVGKSRVDFDYYRNATLTVPYRLRLNSDYVTSLMTALEATENNGPCVGGVTVKPAGVFNFTRTARYGDLHKYNLVTNKFLYNKARLQMTLYAESGEQLYQDLFLIKYLTPDTTNFRKPTIVTMNDYSSNCSRNITINGSDWVGDNLLILQVNPELLKRVARVEIKAI